jgi:hypothetical protein
MSLKKRTPAANSQEGRGRFRPLEPQPTMEQYIIRDGGAGWSVSLETEHLLPIGTDASGIEKQEGRGPGDLASISGRRLAFRGLNSGHGRAEALPGAGRLPPIRWCDLSH